MLKKISLFSTLAFVFASSVAQAAIERNDVPSCTQGIDPQLVTNSSSARELFVVIDRSMSSSLNDNIMRESYNQILRFIQPGDSVQIVQFSSLQKDGFTNVAFKGKTELPLPKASRDHVRKSQLAQFDKCLVNQKAFFSNSIGQQLKNSFVAQQATANTEMIGSLRDIGNDIVKRSMAERKVVLIISDMLENSETTSFYAKGSVRSIEPSSELNLVTQSKFLSDFSGADIYVMGAGLLPGGEHYVSSQKMGLIETFWQGYFSKSNGNLRGFGKPMLLSQFR